MVCRPWRDIVKEIEARRRAEHHQRLMLEPPSLTRRVKAYPSPRRLFASLHSTPQGVYLWGGMMEFNFMYGSHSTDMHFFSFAERKWTKIICSGDLPS